MTEREASGWTRRRRAQAALVAVCGGVLVLHAGHGGRVTLDLVSGPWRAQAEAADDRLRCLAERLEELVPPGSRVHVGPGPGFELQQRITELVAYADAQVVSEPATADVMLDAGPEAAGGGCGGVALRVARAD